MSLDRQQEKAVRRYQRLFKLFSSKVEAPLVYTVLILLGSLMMGQLLLQIPAVRQTIVWVEQLEGNAYHYEVQTKEN